MSLLDLLFRPAKPETHDCDDLCRLVKESNITTREAWEIINTKREGRGERPIEPPPPSFEELIGTERPYPR